MPLVDDEALRGDGIERGCSVEVQVQRVGHVSRIRIVGRRWKQSIANAKAIDVAVLAEISRPNGDGGQPTEHTATRREIFLPNEHAAHEEPVLGVTRIERDATFE